MKLPHVSIEYREDESFALGKMSGTLIVGFGVHWAWVYLAMFNSAQLFGIPTSHHGVSSFAVSLVVFFCTLFCYGIFLEPMRRLFGTAKKRKHNRLAAAIMVFAGTLLMCFEGSPGMLGLVSSVASGLLTGVGSAVLLMSYGISFSVCDTAEATVSVSLSLLLGMVLFVAILFVDLFAHPAGAILCMAAPIAELVCLNRCSAQLVDNLSFAFASLPVHTVSFAIHVCLPSLMFGFIVGIVRMLAVNGQASIGIATTAVPYVLAGACACILMFIALITQRQCNNFMFRTLLPIVGFSLMTLALATNLGEPAITFLLMLCCLLLEACVWVFCADISQRFRISGFTVFGFGRGSLALGTLISFFLFSSDFHAQGIPCNFGTLAAIALFVLVFGMALLPKNAELRRTLKLGANCPALAGDEQYARITDDEFAHLHAENPERQHDEKALSAAEQTAQTAETAIPQPPANHVDESTNQALDNIEAQLDSKELEQKKRGWFKRKCAQVAETYLLSRKETEVLFLLAKGHNSATIQEQLFISAGTANTHMRHIYRKLNVHSQQELIRLVDNTELPD